MITFATQSVAMPNLSRFDYKDWIVRTAMSHGCKTGNINYLFCDDETVIDYNRRFLGHDYYTDIITFDDSANGTINGDILISLDTVRSNAEKFSASYKDELDRVIIHGVLHLCGINDKNPGEREIMEAAENAALASRKYAKQR